MRTADTPPFFASLARATQAEGMVIERFGKFNKVLFSGWNWVIPFIDQPRTITWRKTQIGVDGRLEDETVTAKRIDLRESTFNFMKQEVYTRDTVLLDVNSLMFYRIFDIKKATYEVEDLQSALSNTAQTQLKEVFGRMTFTEALASQRAINEHLVSQFSKLFLGWGIHVERMELLDLMPKAVGAGSIGEAMKKQMIAERQRRGDFIISEGKKSAMKLLSEGSMKVRREPQPPRATSSCAAAQILLRSPPPTSTVPAVPRCAALAAAARRCKSTWASLSSKARAWSPRVRRTPRSSLRAQSAALSRSLPVRCARTRSSSRSTCWLSGTTSF